MSTVVPVQQPSHGIGTTNKYRIESCVIKPRGKTVKRILQVMQKKKYIPITKTWHFADYIIIIINNDWGLEKDTNKKK